MLGYERKIRRYGHRLSVSRLDRHNFEWFAARLMLAVYDENAARRKLQEKRMSVEVKGLAETVRKAKAAIGKASDAAVRMQSSAENLTSVLGQVESMTAQLDAASAELQAAVGGLSNGGPPLDDTKSGASPGASDIPPSPTTTTPGEAVAASIVMVDAANKA